MKTFSEIFPDTEGAWQKFTCRANGGEEIKTELDKARTSSNLSLSITGATDGPNWVGRVRSKDEMELEKFQELLEKKYGWKRIQID
jgi:hypothetical protein